MRAGSVRRTPPWGLAICVVSGENCEIVLDAGADELGRESYFEIGSVTKTMTGLLVADSIQRGEASPDTTVGAILGKDSGNCRDVTLIDLVTQHSGLPRLPPNMGNVDRRDPYANYTQDDLIDALRLVEPPVRSYGYSNFGFMVLGFLLSRITSATYADALRVRIFEPLGMNEAVCGIPSDERRLPGYTGAARTPWWRTDLPGALGVACTVDDLARYLSAHLNPPDGLAAPIDLALALHTDGPNVMGFGWVHQGGGHWHNGGTGGFRSFVAFHRPTKTAIGLLANSHDVESLDRVGFAVLTDFVRSHAP